MSSAYRTHYDVLGVPPSACEADILKAFRSLATVHHPDRPTGNAELFASINEAYEILSNPVQKALYDLDVGLVTESPEAMKRIHNLRRTAAMKELRNMIEKSKQIAEIEKNRNGLLILEAKYGDISSLRKKGKSAALGASRVLDVTVQMQSFVSDSMVILREGQSKSWIEGFYDVCEGECENELEVIYKLGGKLHSVNVGEFEELVIPQQSHLMSSVQVFEWENQMRRKSNKLNDLKAKRRMMLYSALLVTGLGLYYVGFARTHGWIPKFLKQWVDTLANWTKITGTSSSSSSSAPASSSSGSNSTLLQSNSAVLKDAVIPKVASTSGRSF